jgi:hypothetical protein
MNALFGYRDIHVYFYGVPANGGNCLTQNRILDLYDAYANVRSGYHVHPLTVVIVESFHAKLDLACYARMKCMV